MSARRENACNGGRIAVLLLTTSFPIGPHPVSGIFVRKLAEHLPPEVEVEVLTPCPDRPIDPAVMGGLRVRCFRYAPWGMQTLAHRPGGIPVALRRSAANWLLLPLLLASMLLGCLRGARRSRVIHANWAINGVVAALAGRLAGVPVLTTLRGADVTEAERGTLSRLLLRACVRLSTRVAVVGEAVGAAAMRNAAVPPGRVEVVPNGVDRAFLDVPDPRPGPGLRLVTVGSLIPRKGVDTLLRALARLPAELPFELALVGDGPLRGELEALAAQLGVRERVLFLGQAAPQAVPGILAEYPVYATASRGEGRSNSLIEALAAARAVVASHIPENAELVRDGENGLLFAADDSAALAGRLVRLAGDPALVERLGRAARRSILELDLTWEATGRRYAAIYADMAGERRG